VNKSSGIEARRLEDLLAPDVKRVAIANPAHAPYGAAAMQAFKSVGLWGALKGKLVYAENIRQALRFVQTGDAQAGIVALSVVEGGGGEWTYTNIPETLHEPVDQAVAVVKSTGNPEGAMRFIGYVKGTEGRAVMKRYGFTPHEDL
jgi:molybdate transport system substrate-binding protein